MWQYLDSISYVTDAVLGAGDIVVNKIDKVSCFCVAYSPVLEKQL